MIPGAVLQFLILTAIEVSGTALCEPAAAVMLKFMHCSLPPENYIVTHAQRREGAEADWQPVITDLQCFRTCHVPELKVVLWRKDHVTADYYGEIFTYDDRLIRLHTETFPARTAVDPEDHTWDERPDRFRLFVEAREEEDWRLGRIMAPLDASLEWRHQGRIHTYICSDWKMYHDRTAPRWQHNFLDNEVFLERYGPFSTTYDGPSPEGFEPDDTFTQFDEVIVIHQCMENAAGRERFFFARKDDTHYGLVRWDNAVKRDGEWVTIERTIGLRIGTQELEFSFAGMIERALEAQR